MSKTKYTFQIPTVELSFKVILDGTVSYGSNKK